MNTLLHLENALLNWPFGHTRAEQMCARFLVLEGCTDVQPQSPRGGPDETKDIVFCSPEGESGIAGCFFPAKEQDKSTAAIKAKFEHDLAGALKHGPQVFVFFTGQRLSLGLRKKLLALSGIRTLIYEHDALLARHADLLPYMGGQFTVSPDEIREAQVQNDIACIRLIIGACDFFGLEQAFERAPSHIGSAFVNCEELAELLGSERIHLFDRHLEELICAWWHYWMAARWATVRAFNLNRDFSISFQDDKNTPWAREYLESITAHGNTFRSSYANLLAYIRLQYPHALLPAFAPTGVVAD